MFQRLANNYVARVLRVGNRAHRPAMFVAKCDCRPHSAGYAHAGVDLGAAAGGLCHRFGLLRCEQESRVGSEHGIELRPFPAGAEGIEIGLCKCICQRLTVLLRRDRRNQPTQARSAALHAFALKLCHQRLDRIQIKFSAFQLARQVKAQLEYGVE